MNTVDSLVDRVFVRWPITVFVSESRAVRFVEFLLVGACGMVVDLSVTFALLDKTHYLLANLMGFIGAVTFNFTGNWILTYSRPNGSKLKQYLSYVGLHASTFGARAITVYLFVDAVGGSATIGTIIGVGVAALLNFVGNERIFRGHDELWLSMGDSLNHIAHVVYNSRLRAILLRTGFYNGVFRLYALGLACIYRTESREINVNGVSAEILTEYPTELVSLTHTLEKEQAVLDSFIAEIEESDTILDVGANIGVFSCVAGQIADQTVAVEPHEPTAERCKENLRLNDVAGTVHNVALGDANGSVELTIQNDAPGTQRPEVAADGTQTVAQVRGDELEIDPDVVKIDVEGAERQVLMGLAESLNDVRTVFLEAHSQTDAEALELLVATQGFETERLQTDSEQVYLRAE